MLNSQLGVGSGMCGGKYCGEVFQINDFELVYIVAGLFLLYAQKSSSGVPHCEWIRNILYL